MGRHYSTPGRAPGASMRVPPFHEGSARRALHGGSGAAWGFRLHGVACFAWGVHAGAVEPGRRSTWPPTCMGSLALHGATRPAPLMGSLAAHGVTARPGSTCPPARSFWLSSHLLWMDQNRPKPTKIDQNQPARRYCGVSPLPEGMGTPARHWRHRRRCGGLYCGWGLTQGRPIRCPHSSTSQVWPGWR
jgi:hypothetical protein